MSGTESSGHKLFRAVQPIATMVIASLSLTLVLIAALSMGRVLETPGMIITGPLITRSAPALRIVVPAMLVALWAYSIFRIAKDWRYFSYFYDIPDEHAPILGGLMRLCGLMSVYAASMILYSFYFALHTSCTPFSTISGVLTGFRCVMPEIFEFRISEDQFLRGLFGDFYELIGPADEAYSVVKDPVFVVVTGLYRMFSQTALFVVPIAIVAAIRARLVYVKRQRNSGLQNTK